MVRLNRFFEGCGCPSLAFVVGGYQEADSQEMLAHWLSSFPSAREVWARIRSFPFDPWGRIDAMMRGEDAFDRPIYSSTYAGQPPINVGPDPTSPLDFAKMLMQTEHIVPERDAFLQAWMTSIEVAGVHGTVADNTPMGVREMLAWFLPLAMSCDVPREFFERSPGSS